MKKYYSEEIEKDKPHRKAYIEGIEKNKKEVS